MKQYFSEYTHFLSRLESLGLFHTELGLGRISAAIAPLAKKLQQIPVLHIVGTNGKGSTSVFLENLARAHGFKTGLFTSPHFLSPRERLRINGKIASKDEWLRMANESIKIPGSDQLTYFELLTLIALLFFVEYRIEIAIVEAGLGGTWDATCVLAPVLSVLTPVGMDHENILGNSLEAIARDKAGTLRGNLAISASQQEAVRTVFTQTAHKTGSPLFWAEQFYRLENSTLFFEQGKNSVNVPLARLGLSGSFQGHNAGLALGAWSLFCQKYNHSWSPASCVHGLETAFHPGRFQFAGQKPLFILDGAHNVMGLQTLLAELRIQKIQPDALIFSCMADKDIPNMLPLIRQLEVQTIMAGIPDNPRAALPEDLAARLGGNTISAPDMRHALNFIPQDAGIVLVCGSLYLLAEFYVLYPQLLENPTTEKEIIS